MCTFDPWHTVSRFERRAALLWKRLPLDERAHIVMMVDTLALCAECKMPMERLAVPLGISALMAPRYVANNFGYSMKLTRENYEKL